MQMSVLNKNIGSMSGYLFRGGLRAAKTGPYLRRELPGDLTMTKPFYCYLNEHFKQSSRGLISISLGVWALLRTRPLFCSEQRLPWGLWRHVTPLLLFK